MFKKYSIQDFLFNKEKYKIEKFILLVLFYFLSLYLTISFHIPIRIVFIPFLLVLLTINLTKIKWYNKRKNIQKSGGDWFKVTIIVIALSVVVFQYVEEVTLKNKVHTSIEGRTGMEDLTIEHIDEFNSDGENYIGVTYTIKSHSTKYQELYHLEGENLIHDRTSEIE
ncbi:hypothetical protein [Salimicrobium flavidum]|uniref:Uncharacterized protein n=1 Tax=Salimicrobium flavidum TaxID=570947 RepID=A0A1N7J7V4_9BACI|nr:hypothetical protein [Salimicrobium flavidum]SIS45347.1 hypothetical protein SAMN05421687_10489 [Salimicrobium flavidum]